jgi:hypothetical protein
MMTIQLETFMKRVITVASLVLSALAIGAIAHAQDNTRNWELGNVVQVTDVHIKDGMFNAYINDLNNIWRKFNEKQIEDGDVISYSMYSSTAQRDGEPDLILVVTYKNWAAFDRSIEYFEEISAEVFGSMEEGRTANINRGELRTIGSTVNLQEIKFKD